MRKSAEALFSALLPFGLLLVTPTSHKWQLARQRGVVGCDCAMQHHVRKTFGQVYLAPPPLHVTRESRLLPTYL